MVTAEQKKLKPSDFTTDQDVRWCPGCGDYAILANIKKVLPSLGLPKEKFVFVSGIGCSSRFPYYMNTFGMHTIHGRAPAVATGLKASRPDLSVWVITGDGDGLSIGGNHLLHAMRRNVDLNIILFNNRIYGLTKGQYSPTSEQGKKTKSSPMGSIDYPIRPIMVALAAEASFVARAVDVDARHLGEILGAAARHKGTSFVEVYQNCVIFNNDAFDYAVGKERHDQVLYLEDGKPMRFGKDNQYGIRLTGLEPEIVTVGENGVTEEDLVVHQAGAAQPTLAYMLASMMQPEYPEPLGILRQVERPTYDTLLNDQVATAIDRQGAGELQALVTGSETWTVD